MNNQCQPYQGRAVPLNRLIKYPAPTRAPGHRELWRSAARQSVKHVLRRAPLYRGNSGASPLFPKVVLGTNAIASVFCGWQHQGQRDNQMTAQHSKESESTKRHHTAKRMICLFLLRRLMRLSSNVLGAQRSSVVLIFVSDKKLQVRQDY